MYHYDGAIRWRISTFTQTANEVEKEVSVRLWQVCDQVLHKACAHHPSPAHVALDNFRLCAPPPNLTESTWQSY